MEWPSTPDFFNLLAVPPPPPKLKPKAPKRSSERTVARAVKAVEDRSKPKKSSSRTKNLSTPVGKPKTSSRTPLPASQRQYQRPTQEASAEATSTRATFHDGDAATDDSKQEAPARLSPRSKSSLGDGEGDGVNGQLNPIESDWEDEAIETSAAAPRIPSSGRRLDSAPHLTGQIGPEREAAAHGGAELTQSAEILEHAEFREWAKWVSNHYYHLLDMPRNCPELTLYTDGSLAGLDDRGDEYGGGAVVYRAGGIWRGSGISLGLEKHSNAMEMWSIAFALSLARDVRRDESRSKIVNDSSQCLKVLAFGYRSKKAMSELDKELQHVAEIVWAAQERFAKEGVSVVFEWTKSHQGTKGNEQADELAKYASHEAAADTKVGDFHVPDVGAYVRAMARKIRTPEGRARRAARTRLKLEKVRQMRSTVMRAKVDQRGTDADFWDRTARLLAC